MKPRPWPLLSLWVALVLTIFGSPGQLPTSEWPWPNQAPELAEDLGRNSADRLAAAGLGDLLELVQLPENILLWQWWGFTCGRVHVLHVLQTIGLQMVKPLNIPRSESWNCNWYCSKHSRNQMQPANMFHEVTPSRRKCCWIPQLWKQCHSATVSEQGQ